MPREQKFPPETASRSTSTLRQNFEKFTEMQTSAFEIYEQQAKTAMESAKQVFPMTPAPFFEMAERGMSEFLTMQRRTLELMLNQSTIYMDTLRASSLEEDGREINKMMRDSAEYFLSIQKKAAEFATQQAQGFADSMRRDAGPAGTPASSAADALQRGTDAFVQAQKGFWELMLKPFEIARTEAHG